MLQAFHAAARTRSGRGLLRILGAIAAAGMVVLAGPTAVAAATADAGVVDVDGLVFAIDFSQCSTISCPDSAPAATSSGSISGASDLGPFTVAWAPTAGLTNVTPSIQYIATCLATNSGSYSVGAAVDSSSTLLISGALLTYNGTANIPASVKLYFGGTLADGAFVPITGEVVITGGGYTIDITQLQNRGSMVAAPTSPPPIVCSGTQTFLASGNFLTIAA